MLDASGIHPALGEHSFMFSREVFPHDGNHTDIGKVAGGKGEVRSGAAQHVLDAAGWRCDVVERDRSHDQNAHALTFPRYFSRIRLNFCRVATGILSRSVRIACASAEPHLQARCDGIALTASRTTFEAFS